MKERFNLSNDEWNEFLKVVSSYKKYGDDVSKFLDKLPNVLDKYMNDLEIDKIGLLKGGRLGLIFSGYSKKYQKDLVLKFIPKFLNIFDIESNAYSRLSDSYMCPVYVNDLENNLIVMERLNNNETLKYKEDKASTEDFFDKVYSNLTVSNNKDPMHYLSILNKYYEGAKDILDVPNFEEMKKKSLERYEEYFKDADLYLIHGDLHSNNIMKNSDGYHAIDPLGYVAPKEFMFARFIITELFFTECSEKYLDELISFISKYFDKEKLLNALYIDSMLFLGALLAQIENYQRLLPKVLNIIELIEKNITVMKEEVGYENSYSIAKTRKLVFGS